MTSSSLPKAFEPKDVESRTYQFWESHQLFKPEANTQPQGRFSLVIPPPNVTGVLHMGHALDSTIQDILIRWHRMLNHKTLWMPGMDHAGIATQNVVERNLREQGGQTKEEMGREAFVNHVWEWANARKSDIANQFKRLGVSPDWERQRFTLDEGLTQAVRHAFVHLYEKGLIYQGTYIVNWCPRCVSAISDIETDYEDESSFLWEIAYPLADGRPVSEAGHPHLVVATTRPETMYGDMAVAVNPKDPRYSQYIGQKVRIPLTSREIPVIADDYVDVSFGTGALKITPAHDPNDFKIAQQHGLEPLWVIDERGRMKAEDFMPEDIRGLERFDARKRTEALLEQQGFLVAKKEHSHRVGHCQRCSTTIEPLLSKQWFVKTQPLAERCLRSLEAGEIRFIPERWTKDYVRWLTDIQDWCISRQLWWGHQIPAWHCGQCRGVTVALETPAQCSACGSAEITQDTDVLDTWFSSGLWPFSTMGWPNTQAEDYKNFYPTDVLVTGFDIIFFWVARMTMFGLELTDQSPFHTVYIHGLIRDEKGQKMSKSKGNTVDPVEVIDEIGCDGFRFGLTSLITYGGQDIKLNKEKLEQGKLFGNKLWNASRFVLMNIGGEDAQGVDDQPIDLSALSLMDRWVLSRYNTAVREANRLLKEFKFGELADTLYEFIWNGFCDWYVEYAKKQMQDPALRANTQRVLLHVLSGILRLMHPIMPYITEEIFQKLPHRKELSVSIAPYPQADESLIDEGISQRIDYLLEVVRSLRNIRQQYTVPHQQAVKAHVVTTEPMEKEAIESGLAILNHFIRLEQFEVRDVVDARQEHVAVNVVGHSRIVVSLEGLIDIGQELDRVRKKMDALIKEKDQLDKMMMNFEFLERAPLAVVEKNKARLQEVNKQVKALEEQLSSLSS
ncbi:valine--tRNA ligase [Vampirovibrio chlorellavorus]|uniref:valine--tRNA ligase n=1 Tax=Vampirovibrio chlorellavorus TaxID=758823 RepID=UPI0026EEBCD2|nr:valine--tRNA ligase [Vampirovibrio chlorellavorus]